MASAVRSPLVSLLGAIDTSVTSPSPAVPTSCSAISTPYMSESSMTSLPSRTSVWVAGSSCPGVAGSGICFTHTTTFMGGDSGLTQAGLYQLGAPRGRVAQRSWMQVENSTAPVDPGIPPARPRDRLRLGEPDGVHGGRGRGSATRHRRAVLRPHRQPAAGRAPSSCATALDGAALEVEGVGHFNGAAKLPLTLTDLSERILDALVDEHELLGRRRRAALSTRQDTASTTA